MPNAVFSSNLTYTPGGGGSLTQSFGVAFPYSAISAGTIDILSTAASPLQEFTIPIGGANQNVCGLLIKNNTTIDVGLRLNTLTSDIFNLAPGSIFMHWAPTPPKALPLSGATITTAKAIEGSGAIDFIVLGN